MSSPLESFYDRIERIHDLSHAARILDWDQQVSMPESGATARAKQLGTLSRIEHELVADPDLGDTLAAIDERSLDADEAADVREMRRRHRRAVDVPASLVERTRAARSEAFETWQRARADDDWDTFAPVLEDLLALRREYAAHVAGDRDPYAVLFEEFEPYLGLDTAERVFDRLVETLPSLIADVRASDAHLATDTFRVDAPDDSQEALSRAVLDYLEYDWDRGRLDVSTHPFSRGSQYDSRVTTRFDPGDVLDGLTSTVHEFGHATYVHGIPDEYYGRPRGEPRGMTVHESQSRFWENHVARSRAFWEQFLPAAREHVPALADATPRGAYEAANAVDPDNVIRVDADELTYHLHVALRFELERDLVRGNLAVEDVPDAWNAKMDAYLGIAPDSVADGPLQDPHWSNATFGYFPTYTLGSVMAAGFAAAIERDRGPIDAVLERDGPAGVREWLVEHVHAHGCRYTTPDLYREATGESFSADPFLEYVDEKYRSLYDV